MAGAMASAVVFALCVTTASVVGGVPLEAAFQGEIAHSFVLCKDRSPKNVSYVYCHPILATSSCPPPGAYRRCPPPSRSLASIPVNLGRKEGRQVGGRGVGDHGEKRRIPVEPHYKPPIHPLHSGRDPGQDQLGARTYSAGKQATMYLSSQREGLSFLSYAQARPRRQARRIPR